MPDKPKTEVIEGEVVESKAITQWTPSFVVPVQEAVALARQKREYLKQVMVEGTHYGKIPGTDKDVLFLAGAQTLSSNMALHPVFGDAAPAIEDWDGGDHPDLEGNPEPFLSYRRFCELHRQTGPAPTDYMVVARAEGSCNSWESKYRYRNAPRKCPSCGKTGFIFKSKPPRKGFFCWNKPEAGKQGCGANFKEDDPKIINQSVGRVKNPDVLDQANTILKMADKRAYVAATLQATGCADLFTQDLEDAQGPEDIPEEEVSASATTSTPPAPASTTPAAPASTPPSAPAAAPAAPTATTPTVATSKTTTDAATTKNETKTSSPAPAAEQGPVTGKVPADDHDRAAARVARDNSASQPLVPDAGKPASPPVLEPAEIDGAGPLRTKALQTAIEAQRIHAEAKYPGQTFTAHQLEAVARRSIDKWLEREKGKKQFQEATEDELQELVSAIEKTLQSSAA